LRFGLRKPRNILQYLNRLERREKIERRTQELPFLLFNQRYSRTWGDIQFGLGDFNSNSK